MVVYMALGAGRLRAQGATAPAVESPPGATTARTLRLACELDRVAQFQRVSFQIPGLAPHADASDPNERIVELDLRSPSGRRFTVPGFLWQDYERRMVQQGGRVRDWLYPKGGPEWRARFTPDEPGVFEASARVRDGTNSLVTATVRFECFASTNRGFLRSSRRDPRFFELTSGQAFFPIGQNLAFIGDEQYVSLSKAETIFDQLNRYGANYLRVWTCCEDWALAIEARKSAWGRSWNWRPSFVEVQLEGGQTERAVLLAGNTSSIPVEPSHRTALKPNTPYQLNALIRTDTNAALRLEISGSQSGMQTSDPAHAWTALRHEFTTGPDTYWLSNLRLVRQGDGQVWVRALSLREASGGPELLWEASLLRPLRGFYNPLDCYLLDQLLAMAEVRGIYLQLCLLTRDLYMNDLKDPGSPAYARAIEDARRFMRHAVARWGAYISMGAWEYFNEMDPGLPTDRFYHELGEYLEHVDVCHHLRTTSTWGPSPKDCRHPRLDIADVHFYLRPSDTNRLRHEVDAVLDRTRLLKENAPQKPLHLGEFGLADEKWRLTDEQRQSRALADVHNSLWASALSGASGTAQFWWWERLDQANVYPLYGRLSQFLADVPWNSGWIKPAAATASGVELILLGMRTPDRVWLWMFDPRASWRETVTLGKTPPLVRSAVLTLLECESGPWKIRWWDTHKGIWSEEAKRPAQDGKLSLQIPDFTGDIAVQLIRDEPSLRPKVSAPN
jgi:hypothetical protein